MAIKISPRFEQKITLLVLIPLALFSVGFFFFAYKFQLLPKASNDPQMINTSKAKNGIVWGTPEVWEYNAEDTKDWKTYTSPNLGFSFKYPPKDWYPKDEGQPFGYYNILVTAPTDVYTGQNYHEGQELVISMYRFDTTSLVPGYPIPAEISEYTPKEFYEFFKARNIYLRTGTWFVKEIDIPDVGKGVFAKASNNDVEIYVNENGDWVIFHFGLNKDNEINIRFCDKYIDDAKKLFSTLR